MARENVSHELHDACIALHRELKARDPELTARATARGVPIAIGSPESELGRDLDALNEVASCFATGEHPSRRALKRVDRLIAERLEAA